MFSQLASATLIPVLLIQHLLEHFGVHKHTHIYAHMILKTSQLAGFTHQLGVAASTRTDAAILASID